MIPTRLECYPSCWKTLGLIPAGCLMVGVCYFCASRANLFMAFVGWLGVAFFGYGLIVLVVRTFRGEPEVLVSSEGILDRKNRFGFIPWTEVESVHVGEISGTRMLCVELIDPESHLSRPSPWHRWLAGASNTLGLSTVTIGFVGLSPGLDDALLLVERHAGLVRQPAPEE